MSQARSWAVIALIALAIGGAVWAAKPTDQTREFSGVWLLEFEGSQFFEGATLATVRDFDPADAGWLEEGDAIDVEKLFARDGGYADCYKVRAFALRFKGQRHFGVSGHLGGWNSRYEVAELIEMTPLSWPECESPFDWKPED
ncbi:MAG: hypothetical protein EDM03_13965 [Porphyrobacter sp. IPPAS B-1204]|nr:MAG: hypothetical protein EDM03_13965 [Porphyrobacter sp. IPPAS B-1204]